MKRAGTRNIFFFYLALIVFHKPLISSVNSSNNNQWGRSQSNNSVPALSFH